MNLLASMGALRVRLRTKLIGALQEPSRIVMRHEVGSYLGLNEIESLSPMMDFITNSFLFNCIFGFIH